MSRTPVLSTTNSNAVQRHTADIRIRADQLRWMLESGRLEEAQQAIRAIRVDLTALQGSLDDRRSAR